MTSDVRIFDAIEAIYEVAGSIGTWPGALDSIAQCFDAAGTVLIIQQQDGRLSTIVSPALAAAQQEYEAGYWKHDCLAGRMVEEAMRTHHACLTEQELVTPEEIATHRFFTDFRARHGLGSVIASTLMPHPDIPVVIGVQGVLGQKPYTTKQLALADRLFRNVERSLMLTIRLMETDVNKLGLAEALTRLSCGVFIVDSELNVLFQNEFAKRILGNELTVTNGRIDVAGRHNRSFRDTCQYAIELYRPAAKKIEPLVLRGNDDTSIVLYFLAIGSRTILEEAFIGSRLLILAVEHPRGGRSDPQLVRDLFGLTLAEARLASLIGAGVAPREAADQLNISEGTARTVLKRIFAKTGVGRQAELASLVSQMVSVTSASGDQVD